MDPITIALLVGLGVTVTQTAIKAVQGAKDKNEAKALLDKAGIRPDYEMPESVDKMVGMYEQMAQSGLPGEDQMKQDIQGSTARSITAAGQLSDSPIAALGAAQGAQQRELGALRDLSIRSEQFQSQQKRNLAGAYGQEAQWQDAQNSWNQRQPWEIAQNEYWNLRRGGRESINQGIDQAGSGIQQAAGVYAQSQMYGQSAPNYDPSAANQSYMPQPTSVPYTNTGGIPSSNNTSFYPR